jgi:hypothetical protein
LDLSNSGQTRGSPLPTVRAAEPHHLREARMGDTGASGNASGLPSGWRVEIDGGSLLPQGAHD